MSAATQTKQQRNAALKQAADSIRGMVATLNATTEAIGAELQRVADSLFSFPAESDAFYRWAENVTGWKVQQVKNAMSAHVVRGQLTKSQQGKTALWSADTMAAVARIKPEDRSKVLGAIKATRPSAADVRATRDRIVPTENSGTNRKSNADKTLDLAADLKPRVANLLRGKRDALDLLAAGAQIAQDLAYGDRDVPANKNAADAIRLLKQQVLKQQQTKTAKTAKSDK